MKQPRFLICAAIVVSIFLSENSAASNEAYYWQNLAGQPGGRGNVNGGREVARFSKPEDVVVAPNGDIFVADLFGSSIRKIAPDGEVTTFAGSPVGERGNVDGLGTEARFNGPAALDMDAAGNLYVGDQQVVRKVTPEGLVTTVAGMAGESGTTDGVGSAARFNALTGIAVDSSDNLFVVDRNSHTIRKITSDGVVTTLAGSAGQFGSSDGNGAVARFSFPRAVDLDAAGNLFVCDQGNRTIRRVTPTGEVTTTAGSPGQSGSVDGLGSSARFSSPSGIAVSATGVIYVGDSRDNTLRKIDANGFVSTLAGSADEPFALFADGPGDVARFRFLHGVALDAGGNIIVADSNFFAIRSVTPMGETTTIAGIPPADGHADGTGNAALFFQPRGIVVSQDGTAFVLDSANFSIRKITAAGVVTTFAGSPEGFGSVDGVGSAARFSFSMQGLAIDHDDNLYVSDSSTSTIRKVTPAGEVSTLAGSPDLFGSTDGTGSDARFSFPGGVAVDSSGNVFVADTFNHTIRKISPAGVVSTFAGEAGTFGTDDGVGAAARFSSPLGLTTGPGDILYVTDSFGITIRRVSPEGVVSTLAGNPLEPGSADGTLATARFTEANGIAADAAGNLFLVAENGLTVRKISTSGIVTTVGGSPGAIGGADGLGKRARFSNATTSGSPVVRGITVDQSGRLYLSDGGNNRITVGTLQQLRITSIEAGPTQVTLQWSPFGNGQYKIQASGSLGVWTDLPLVIPPGQTSAVIPKQVGDREQFYRVRPAD